MSDNKKQEKDFTPEVDSLLPEADKLVKVRPTMCTTIASLNSDITTRLANYKRLLTSFSCLRNRPVMYAYLYFSIKQY